MMDDRRLVGMTNGAKKRAAFREAVDAWHPPPREGYVPSLDECCAAARKRYRVGERLRVCRWCDGPSLRWLTCPELAKVLWILPDDPCDGSGVVRK